MKQCPNCKKTYGDDMFYCLDDGVALSTLGGGIDRDARTEVINLDPETSIPTAVINTQPAAETVREKPSKLPYAIIAGLGLVCLILAAGIVLLVLKMRGPEAQSDNSKAAASPTTSPISVQTNAPPGGPASPSPGKSPGPSPSSSPLKVAAEPSGKWSGTWSTDSGTLLRIVVTLTNKAGLEYEGTIVWTLVKTVRPDKASKVGLSATEFVRGVFDPDGNILRLAGYGKDDPDEVLVMTDQYKLNLSADGKTMNGVARNGGKWNGRVRLSK